MQSKWSGAAACISIMLSGSPGSASVLPPPSSSQSLQRWFPGDVRCGATTLPAASIRRPFVSLSWANLATPPRTYQFGIDANGYPFSITGPVSGYDPGTSDIAPSLAATHFKVSAAHNSCEVTYTSKPASLMDAPVGDLISYTITPTNGRLPEQGWARIRPAGGDCDQEPRAQWLRVILPDFTRLGGEPGARDWSVVSYDLDAKGRPKALKLIESTRNPVLDRAALKSMAESRQTGGPRRGCLNPYHRNATRLPPPSDVDMEKLRPTGATCLKEVDWEKEPVLRYPESWSRRAIEGWAIIGFDVAPWGATGNVRVLASEPSNEFGEAAIRIISEAKAPSNKTGYVGCVQRVRYIMGPGAAYPSTPARAAVQHYGYPSS